MSLFASYWFVLWSHGFFTLGICCRFQFAPGSGLSEREDLKLHNICGLVKWQCRHWNSEAFTASWYCSHWSMCVLMCVCVCVCVCVYACIRACVCACVCVLGYTCVLACVHSHYCVCTGESVHIITYKPSHSVICHAAAPMKEGEKKQQCVSKLSSFSLSLVSLSLCFLSVSLCESLSVSLFLSPSAPPPLPPTCLINQGYLLIFSVLSLSSLGLPVFSIMLPPFPAPFMVMVMMMMMRWSSPQLLVHGGELTQNSDSWGVGCVLYEMLTGARPWYHLRHCRKEDMWQQVMFHPHLLACVVAV